MKLKESFSPFFSLSKAAHRGGYYFTCHLTPTKRKDK
nr:MAG TPA: S-adenosylmethionine decarboxylase beta chain [Caudoviricetes sp.]